MSLINSTIPFIETYSEPLVRRFSLDQPTSGMVVLEDYAKSNDLWYCLITTVSSLEIFSIVDLMEPGVYQKILDRSASIVIDLSFEPFLECIDVIYKNVVLAHGIPPSQVIFMNNMFDAYEYNKDSAIRHNSSPIRIFYFSSLEYMLNEKAKQREPNNLQVKDYSKKFLNLNRRWRDHRPLTILLLRYRNLLDKGHISFGPCENHADWKEIWDGLCVGGIGNTYLETAIRESRDIMDMEPMYLDTNELHTNRAELHESTDPYYADSYFSLVSETTYYHRRTTQNSRFITEKTFKPIAMKHPFLLITIPKSLEVLKFLGYKTFSPWINESYDNEMNDNNRLLMILDEVERLSNMSNIEVASFVIEINKICEYNFNLLKSKTRYVYEMGESCAAI